MILSHVSLDKKEEPKMLKPSFISLERGTTERDKSIKTRLKYTVLLLQDHLQASVSEVV